MLHDLAKQVHHQAINSLNAVKTGVVGVNHLSRRLIADNRFFQAGASITVGKFRVNLDEQASAHEGGGEVIKASGPAMDWAAAVEIMISEAGAERQTSVVCFGKGSERH